MAAFSYKALDEAGKETSGIIEADTERQIRQQLRDKGLIPTEVSAVAASQSLGKGTGRFGAHSASAKELALISRQLATMISSGLPLAEAIEVTAKQAGKSRLSHMLMDVRSHVLEGHDLATGLRQYPRVFPEIFWATVEAGEHSGHLAPVLERLADYTEARLELRQRIQAALLYPAILTTMALLVVAFLLAVVVPEVVQVFQGVDQQLPPLTLGLIAISDWLVGNGVALAFALLLLAAVIKVLYRIDAIKQTLHGWANRIPLMASVIRGLDAARFARTFSILLSSGVPVLDGFRISAQVVTNLHNRKLITGVGQNVREGSAVAPSLEAAGFIPPIMIHLIASGEHSGRLPAMLEKAADVQDREIQRSITTFLGLFEPIMILFMGGIVLAIILAVLLPIFELNQLVAG